MIQVSQGAFGGTAIVIPFPRAARPAAPVEHDDHVGEFMARYGVGSTCAISYARRIHSIIVEGSAWLDDARPDWRSNEDLSYLFGDLLPELVERLYATKGLTFLRRRSPVRGQRGLCSNIFHVLKSMPFQDLYPASRHSMVPEVLDAFAQITSGNPILLAAYKVEPDTLLPAGLFRVANHAHATRQNAQRT